MRGRRRCAGWFLQAYVPELALCTDNGAMIAFTAAMRLQAREAVAPDRAWLSRQATGFDVRPRWPLADLD